MDPLLLRQHLELEERHWWFVARRRIVLAALERHLGESRDLEILDAGCGGGATLQSLGRYGRARGMELSEEAVRYARERGRDVEQGSIDRLPFAAGEFDLALALDVVEHVQDDLRALKELGRVLRLGGWLLVTVPALEMLWSAHDVANGHYRRYTLDELQGRMREAGFEVVAATYFNSLLFPAILASRGLQRLRPKKAVSDVSEAPAPLNSLLEGIFSLEARLVGRVRFPFGVSALCLVRKPPV